MINLHKNRCGFTLIELMIAGTLTSVVALGAFSFYTSGTKMLRNITSVEIIKVPEVAIESTARNINLALAVNLTQGNTQLNLRMDYLNCNPLTPDPAGPADSTNDSWWHYRFTGDDSTAGKLLGFCNTSSTTPLVAVNDPSGTVSILDNLNTALAASLPPYPPGTAGTGRSSFQVVNPSGSGTSTVVYIHVNSTNPLKELNTEVAWAASKR